MGLKQIKPEHRIIFLRKFMLEVMGNTLKGEEEKKRVRVQKLKQKFIEPTHPPEKTIQQMSDMQMFMPSKYSRPHKPQISESKREPIHHRMKIPKKSFIQQIRKPLITRKQKQPIKQIPKQEIPSRIQALTSIRPQAQPRPEGFDLGKLEPLLKDQSVQLIECPGPGKNVLVKRHDQINVTRIILNQAEITNIINNFATQAKIPIVGGILKAAVGDMVISAVISEFVGSRFIINKMTPYSIIENQ